MRKGKIFFSAFIFLLFFINFVSAFGVATLYSENYPLRIKPGEVKETFFLLMNTAEGDSDVSIKSELVKGQEISELIDGPKDYDLPFGKEVEVPIKIKIPKDMPIGTKYKVAAMFRPIPKGAAEGGGNIQFIVNIGKSFPIEIVGNDEKKKEGSSITLENEPEELLGKSAPSSSKSKSIWLVAIIFFLIGIIVMMFVIILIVRRRPMMPINAPQQQTIGDNTLQNNQQGNYFRY